MSSDFYLSFDIEEHFQVAAFERQCPPESWTRHESRVRIGTERILAVLDRKGVKATFFVLGWVAERDPALVRAIADCGHEIACHGHRHQRLNLLGQQEFRQDIRTAKGVLEDLLGREVTGYRAPSFSFDEQRPWIQEELLDAGFRYSSSINPVPHDLYGYRNAPRVPFVWPNGLLEIPVATVTLGKRRIPCGGGGYFRLYPYPLTRTFLRRAAAQLQGPVVFYLHPWELDPAQPRIAGASLKSRFRHYLNLHRTESRLHRLLTEFTWKPLNQLRL